MDKQQARELIGQTFTQAFDYDRFHHFTAQLLNHLNDSSERQRHWAGQMIKKAYSEHVNHYERIGTYTDPEGRKLDVLVIHLKKDTTLERGRTLLRNFAADYLSTGHGADKDAVLAAYVSKEETDWRFSYVKLEYALEQDEAGKVKERKELTPARRYSFLVGENEKSHTAQKQFLPLLENDQSDPLLSEIEEAFKIEKVTKEFFEQYKLLFEKTKAALETRLKRDAQARAEFKARAIETDDFAKKLLGQIVFLYFLQKKGWFGVAKNAAWGTGRKDYLRHLFSAKKPDENYFNDVLEPLFYNTLAVERPHDYSDRFRCKIPFLNGGLFEPLGDYDWVHADLLLPDELFANRETTKDGDQGTGILDVFDRYNFTVNEAEPLETEVAVDPEMLGKVFENLLPENLRHKGGTYYTPRVIVNYMCQQSLINYLAAHCVSTPTVREGITREDLETLITRGEVLREFQSNPSDRHKDKLLPESIRKNARQLDRLLADITVCDPAIGSGAFPVGMMQEIVKARLTLASVEGMPQRTAYELKRHAIENSLYGVDVDSSATEIARLRLWLSLVVDELEFERIQPLPNLDYKIMQGNSLLEEFAGVKLFDDDLLAGSGQDTEAQKTAIREEIIRKQNQLIALASKKIPSARELKAKFGKEIEQLTRQLNALSAPPAADQADKLFRDLSTDARDKLAELKRLHKEFFEQSSPKKKKELRQKLEQLEWEFMELKLERSDPALLKELAKHRRDNRKDYFLWKLHFVEVFQAKGGFDVVIGNPPYVRADSGDDHLEMRKAVQDSRQYETLWEKWDLYVAFIERGYKLLKPNGVTTMIVSDAYCHAKYAQKSQNWFLKNSRVLRLDFLGKIQIFEAAVRNVIFFFANADGSSYEPERRVHEGKFGNLTLLPTTSQTALSYRAFFPEESASRTFNVPSVPLHQVFYVSKGMVVNADEKAARGEFRMEDLVVDVEDKLHPKPFVEGKHLDIWLPATHKWLEWGTRRAPVLFSRPTFPEMYSVDEKILVQRSPGPDPKCCYDNMQLHFTESTVGFIPWHNLSGVRNNSLKKAARYEDEKPPRPDLPRREELEQSSRSFNIKYLLAVMNSNLARHFLRSNRRSNIHLYPDDWKKLPVAIASQSQQSTITKLVDYILFLKANIAEDASRDQLMVSYFEQIIDALVYELYLPDEIHSAGREFFAPLAAERLPALAEIQSDGGDKLSALRKIFERLFHKDHVIGQNVSAMDTIESVRIIEGKE